jgi:hypothetical protein
MPRAYLFLDTMPPMGQELMSTSKRATVRHVAFTAHALQYLTEIAR